MSESSPMSIYRHPSNSSLLHDRSSLAATFSPPFIQEHSPTISHSTIQSRYSNGESSGTYTALTFSDINWRLSGSDCPISPRTQPLTDGKVVSSSASHRTGSDLTHQLTHTSSQRLADSHRSANDTASSSTNTNSLSTSSTLTTPVMSHSTPVTYTPLINHTPLLDPSMHDRVITDLADFANLIDTNAYFNTTDQTHALSHYPTQPHQETNSEDMNIAHGYSSNRRSKSGRRKSGIDGEEKPKKKKKRTRSPSGLPAFSPPPPLNDQQPATNAIRVIESLKQSYSKQYEEQVASSQRHVPDEDVTRSFPARKLTHNHGLDIGALTGMKHVEGHCRCTIKGSIPPPKMIDPYDPSHPHPQLAESMRDIVAAVHARFGLNITDHLLDKARVQQRALQRAIDVRLQERGHLIDHRAGSNF